MPRLTRGPGWSLSSDEPPKLPKKENLNSPAAKIRLENRMGKSVTVISGLHTYGSEKLNAIARELKTKCGAGGTVKNGVIEIQGDQVQMIKGWFRKK